MVNLNKLAQDHRRGTGCPRCKKSRGEKEIMGILEKMNIKFEDEYEFIKLSKRRFDFYLPKYNLVIEYHGIQHFKFIKFFHKTK